MGRALVPAPSRATQLAWEVPVTQGLWPQYPLGTPDASRTKSLWVWKGRGTSQGRTHHCTHALLSWHLAGIWGSSDES